MKKIAILTISGLLAACAHKELPPQISYDSADFDTATLAAETPRPVRIVTLPEPLPLPGQLKPAPRDSKPSAPDSRSPKERVEDANAAAAMEPTKDGYINAIQVYPYTDGALYQLYTAPSQVSASLSMAQLALPSRVSRPA